MPKSNQQKKAIALMRKYRPVYLKDIEQLPISEEDKNLMHSQAKVDYIYNSEYESSRRYNAPEMYDEKYLMNRLGPPSFSREEKDQMNQLEDMANALGR